MQLKNMVNVMQVSVLCTGTPPGLMQSGHPSRPLTGTRCPELKLPGIKIQSFNHYDKIRYLTSPGSIKGKGAKELEECLVAGCFLRERWCI